MDRQKEYLNAFQRMIQAETVSDPDVTGGEKFDSFHELMWELFPHVRETCEIREFEGSLLMKWKGKDESLQPVLFMNHQDVVPADPDGWEHPPFSGAVADGKIWGRGTLDDKGGLWAMLQAADELITEGFEPAGDIWFETSCNEETTGHGADTISAWLRNNGVRFSMVLDEGGDIVKEPISGADGTFAMIGIGEKSIANLRFIARSDGGHASTPGKDTPIVRLGKFMARMESDPPFTVSMSPAIAEMLRRLAPYMGRTGKLTAHADKLRRPLGHVMPLLGAAPRAMVSTTIAFTMTGGGEAVNAIPREAWVIGDMRCSHHQGKEASIKAVTKTAARFGIEVEVLESGLESGLTDHEGPAFRLVEEAVMKTVPGVDACAPYIMTGASDSRFMGRVSDQCIRFLPFRISSRQMDTIHGVNECLDIDTLAPAVDFYRYMMTHVFSV